MNVLLKKEEMIGKGHISFEACCLEIRMSVEKHEGDNRKISSEILSLQETFFYRIGYARHEFGTSSQ